MDKEQGIFLTKGVQDSFHKDEEFAIQVLDGLAKFMKKDWGDIPDSDKDINKRQLETKDSVMGKYPTKLGNIYIIMEKGHEITTVLFTNEY